MLRRTWGLNALLAEGEFKNRDDHRHHAIDAIVVGCTDRGLLQRVSRCAAASRERLLEDAPRPWTGFRGDVGAALADIVVAHRRDHGEGGSLHNDTAYGVVDGPDAKGMYTVVARKNLADLKAKAFLGDHDPRRGVVDPGLHAQLQALAREAGGDEKLWKQLVAGTGVRRVRVHTQLGNVVPVTRKVDGRDVVYKVYKADGNHCMDVLVLPDGRWRGACISRFEAHQRGRAPSWKGRWPAARRLLRLYVRDLIEVPEGDRAGVYRVAGISGEVVTLADHREGGDLRGRHRDAVDPFAYWRPSVGTLGRLGASQFPVDALGDQPPRPA
jgi:CRISPR-associated endonuclease Csn1